MDMEGLYQCQANYVPLSPISFLERASFVYEKSVSIIYGDIKYTWSETYKRCHQLASALTLIGVNRRGVVAAMAPNVPALYELHFGVPMAGAVLCALNTRLDASTLATKLEELEAKVFLVDYQYVEIVLKAFELLSRANNNVLPRLVMISESHISIVTNAIPSNTLDYNELLSIGKFDFKIAAPNDECDPISINYTSGSTGKPKGVVYSHRSAYLNSLSIIFRHDLRKMPVFLWTVDMFRCNGWCFPWAMAALGGTNICVREVSAKTIFDSIVNHKVTHLFGAPTILDKIVKSKSFDERAFSTNVDIIVAGPLPPLETLEKIEVLGFNINHGYGMTEALGPMTVRSLKTKDEMSLDYDEDVKIKYREGTHNLLMADVDVKNPETMESVPPNGTTIGEIMFRGNVVMLGYLKNHEGTHNIFKGGWYRTGDLGTRNPNGYIEMKDRALDTIISEGAIISTMDVERVIMSHPMVKDVAVVGKQYDILGEAPCAFVTLKDECFLSSDEIIKFCEEKLSSRNMIPKNVYFGTLPLNSTGKIQKFLLKVKAKTMGSLPCTDGH